MTTGELARNIAKAYEPVIIVEGIIIFILALIVAGMYSVITDKTAEANGMQKINENLIRELNDKLLIIEDLKKEKANLTKERNYLNRKLKDNTVIVKVGKKRR